MQDANEDLFDLQRASLSSPRKHRDATSDELKAQEQRVQEYQLQLGKCHLSQAKVLPQGYLK